MLIFMHNFVLMGSYTTKIIKLTNYFSIQVSIEL